MIKNSRDYEIKVIPPNEEISKEKFWAFRFFVTKSWDAILPQVHRVNVNRPPYVIVKDLQTGKGETRSQIKLEGFGSIWIRAYTVNGTVHDESCFIISGQGLVDYLTDKHA